MIFLPPWLCIQCTACMWGEHELPFLNALHVHNKVYATTKCLVTRYVSLNKATCQVFVFVLNSVSFNIKNIHRTQYYICVHRHVCVFIFTYIIGVCSCLCLFLLTIWRSNSQFFLLIVQYLTYFQVLPKNYCGISAI